ncbi:FtsW/RodA/SpoVE family cell cycle protein [Bombilactobacillus thymidiniphilus]|uniref:FtsW/RodA/SpoVE family cell cycle protein n=1 Tax=Bombilactobacillus thymidiniphilus TaxID=2923363 RepID=A0ABY4PE50_9LACO|nr:FtsW/RodA/SpoVE family cell cycle protein [Bombilactobacillus thymidiniphilus]UQS83835.1 FtsW/RodA/SpoVE family cell cycle protein [Bombilactobacillus thymidiniphilus]
MNVANKRSNQNKDENSRIDYGVIFSVMLLALIGLVSIYVAASHDLRSVGPWHAVISQLAWYVVGAIGVIIIMHFDTQQLWNIAPYAYWFGIALLIAVLFFYSRDYAIKTGAKSWFALGPLSFQPSEIMKPAFILMLGRVVTTHNHEYRHHTLSSDRILISRMILWSLPVVVLMLLQKDFGTMLVFLAILAGVMLVSGIDWRILVSLCLIVVLLGTLAISLVATDGGREVLSHIGFHAYQFERIDSWLDPSRDTSNNSYQLWQNLKAIGSGKLFGKGFNHSNVYVPVRESDMIFSVIAENFGFIGSCFLIIVYFMLISQMIKVTFDTRNEFYAYVSTGIIMMILFHVFENIGMSIGLLPMTGIPLPFISQGGSSLLANMIGVGMIMSMRYHYKSYMFSGNDFQ